MKLTTWLTIDFIVALSDAKEHLELNKIHVQFCSIFVAEIVHFFSQNYVEIKLDKKLKSNVTILLITVGLLEFDSRPL